MPGMPMGGMAGTGRLGAEFPIFTGPAKISTMIQRVQSIESVAATATGKEQMMLMASASSMRDEAEKAIATATMMGGMEMDMKGAAATMAPVVGWGVAAVGVGLLLI